MTIDLIKKLRSKILILLGFKNGVYDLEKTSILVMEFQKILFHLKMNVRV